MKQNGKNLRVCLTGCGLNLRTQGDWDGSISGVVRVAWPLESEAAPGKLISSDRAAFLVECAAAQALQASGIQDHTVIDGLFVASMTSTFEAIKRYFDAYRTRQMTASEAIATDSSLVGTQVTFARRMEGVAYRYVTAGRVASIHSFLFGYEFLAAAKGRSVLMAAVEARTAELVAQLHVNRPGLQEEMMGEVGAALVMSQGTPAAGSPQLCAVSIGGGPPRSPAAHRAILEQTLHDVLERAALGPGDIGMAMGSTAADPYLADIERQAVRAVLGEQISLWQPGRTFGDLLGAESAVHVILGSLALRRRPSLRHLLVVCTDYENVGALIMGVPDVD